MLPLDVWYDVLGKSVVDTALMSDSPRSLSDSITNHALVCRAWSSIVRAPLFKKKAKARLYDTGAKFFS